MKQLILPWNNRFQFAQLEGVPSGKHSDFWSTTKAQTRHYTENKCCETLNNIKIHESFYFYNNSDESGPTSIAYCLFYFWQTICTEAVTNPADYSVYVAYSWCLISACLMFTLLQANIYETKPKLLRFVSVLAAVSNSACRSLSHRIIFRKRFLRHK